MKLTFLVGNAMGAGGYPKNMIEHWRIIRSGCNPGKQVVTWSRIFGAQGENAGDIFDCLNKISFHLFLRAFEAKSTHQNWKLLEKCYSEKETSLPKPVFFFLVAMLSLSFGFNKIKHPSHTRILNPALSWIYINPPKMHLLLMGSPTSTPSKKKTIHPTTCPEKLISHIDHWFPLMRPLSFKLSGSVR